MGTKYLIVHLALDGTSSLYNVGIFIAGSESAALQSAATEMKTQVQYLKAYKVSSLEDGWLLNN